MSRSYRGKRKENAELVAAVARATGESAGVIRQRGFSLCSFGPWPLVHEAESELNDAGNFGLSHGSPVTE